MILASEPDLDDGDGLGDELGSGGTRFGASAEVFNNSGRCLLDVVNSTHDTMNDRTTEISGNLGTVKADSQSENTIRIGGGQGDILVLGVDLD